MKKFYVYTLNGQGDIAIDSDDHFRTMSKTPGGYTQLLITIVRNGDDVVDNNAINSALEESDDGGDQCSLNFSFVDEQAIADCGQYLAAIFKHLRAHHFDLAALTNGGNVGSFEVN